MGGSFESPNAVYAFLQPNQAVMTDSNKRLISATGSTGDATFDSVTTKKIKLFNGAVPTSASILTIDGSNNVTATGNWIFPRTSLMEVWNLQVDNTSYYGGDAIFAGNLTASAGHFSTVEVVAPGYVNFNPSLGYFGEHVVLTPGVQYTSINTLGIKSFTNNTILHVIPANIHGTPQAGSITFKMSDSVVGAPYYVNFEDNFFVGQDLHVHGIGNIDGACAVGGNLSVTGSMFGGSLSLANAGTALTVSNNATIGGTLSVTGTTTMGAATVSSLSNSGNSTTTGNATIGGTLGVTGTTTLGTANITTANCTNSSLGAATASTLSTSSTISCGTSLSVSGTSNLVGLVTANTISAATLNGTAISNSGTWLFNSVNSSATGVSMPSITRYYWTGTLSSVPANSNFLNVNLPTGITAAHVVAAWGIVYVNGVALTDGICQNAQHTWNLFPGGSTSTAVAFWTGPSWVHTSGSATWYMWLDCI